MTAKYSHTSGVIRTYAKDKNYDLKDEYTAIVSVIWASESHVVLFGSHGEYGKQDIKDVFHELVLMGAKTAEIARAKGRRMPWGTLIRSDEFEDWYSVDLMEVLG